MKIGIIGYGFVGKALEKGLKSNVDILKIDPKLHTAIAVLNFFNPDILFICVPTPMNKDSSQDISILTEVLEQIKLDVAHDCLPIIFIGDGAGFVYSHLGTSHQSLEDIACTRVIPNLSVYSPADRLELTQCMELAYRENSAIYLRIGKSDRGDIHKSLSIIEPKKMLKVKKGVVTKYSFLATGSMVRTAIDIAVESYPEADVWSVPIIKPINYIQIEKICRNSKAIVVFEEHSKYGGLGSLVAEISAEHSPTKILRIATNDCFSQKCGTYEYLLKEHGLDIETIQANIRSFLRNV